MPKITAFIARSFDEKDEPRIQPILKFLDTFHDLGFLCETAEKAEVESVSAKVRRKIEEKDVLIAILTARHHIYSLKSNFTTAWSVFRGKLRPVAFTAPPWVLQEVGYALASRRELIMFREPTVEIPQLPGDLEYIPYDSQNPAGAFQRANEMILGLIRKKSGILVETHVQVSPAPTEQPVLADDSKRGASQSEPPESSLVDYHRGIFDALEKKDFKGAEEAYENGLEHVRAGKGGQEVTWTALYLFTQYQAGISDALEELKTLQQKHPAVPSLSRFVAQCYMQYHEYEKALSYIEQAVAADAEESKAQDQLRQANCLHKLKKHEEAAGILTSLAQDKRAEIRREALQRLYETFKELEGGYLAFSVAEFLLQDNPALSNFRFELGLDYYRSKHKELFLRHYRILLDHDPQNADSLHNFALACDLSKLPILSVASYKKAFELGSTLSANNLASQYLNAGFADEATGLLTNARNKENCVPEVQERLGEIESQRKKESEALQSQTEEASRRIAFLARFGSALLEKTPPSVTGTWKFDFGELPLVQADGRIEGNCKVETTASKLFSLLSRAGPEKTFQTYLFSGRLKGRACEFEIKTRPDDPVLTLHASEEATTRSKGLIVFSSDGASAELAEIKDESLSNLSVIHRLRH